MKRIFTISILFLLMLTMFIPGGMDLVGNTQAAASVSVTLTSNPKFWVDANKCGPEGPRGAWMSFIIKNTGDVDLDYVTITFNGFDLPVYVNPVDNVRLYHVIKAGPLGDGEEVPAFFYVDYAEVCLGTLVGNSSDYSLTVTASTPNGGFSYTASSPVDLPSVSSDTLITAMAAGVLTSTVIGPGIWVGQILEQTVVFDYGNNSGLYFQPAGQTLFNETSYRLVQTLVSAYTPSITGITADNEYNHMYYPDVSVKPNGQITVKFYWEVINPAEIEVINPWAAAQSGQQFKYTGFGTTQSFPVTKEEPLSITKSVEPSYLATPDTPGYEGVAGQVLYTITFTNNTIDADTPNGVDILLYEIYDNLQITGSTAIDGCIKINEPVVNLTGNNEVLDPEDDPTNTYEVNGLDDTDPFYGQVAWVGLLPSNPLVKTYNVLAGNTFTLKFTADVTGCGFNTTHINEAWGTYGGNEETRIETEHITATLRIGGDPTSVNIIDFSVSFNPATMSNELNWTTATDEDFLGFDIMRSESETGPQVQVNPSIIQVDQIGSAMGGQYSFTDNQVQIGRTYFYWINMLGLDGSMSPFGPVSVNVGYKYFIPLLVR